MSQYQDLLQGQVPQSLVNVFAAIQRDITDLQRRSAPVTPDLTSAGLLALLAASGVITIRNIAFAHGTNATMLPYNSYVDIATCELTTHGGLIVVFGWAAISEQKSGLATAVHNYDIYRDGSFLPDLNASGASSLSTDDWGSNAAQFAVESMPSGTYEYAMRGSVADASTTSASGRGGILAIELSIGALP